MHHIGALACLPAKALTEQLGDEVLGGADADGDGFFREAELTPEAWERHGIEWFDDWTEDLKQRHNLNT